MKQKCPACRQDMDFTPPSASSEGEDMQDMLACPRCGSTLKWTGQKLDLVYDNSAALKPAEEEDPPPLKEEAVSSEAVPSEEPDSLEPVASEPPVSELQASPPSEDPPSEDSPAEDSQVIITPPPPPASEETGLKTPPDPSSVPKEEDGFSPPQEDFKDVENFANSEENQKGFLRYDLQITGIDSKELREKLLLILKNPQFQWEAQSLLKNISEGSLLLKKLNPVKMFCLISRLCEEPFQFRWKQYTVLDTPASEDPPKGTQDLQSVQSEEEH